MGPLPPELYRSDKHGNTTTSIMPLHVSVTVCRLLQTIPDYSLLLLEADLI